MYTGDPAYSDFDNFNSFNKRVRYESALVVATDRWS